MMLFRLVKRHYLTNHVDTLTLWNQKKLPNELKKLTFDDIFLGVEGDDGQVAGQPGKAGWNIFLDSDSNFLSFTCIWGVCTRTGRCPRHQSSKVLVGKLTTHHSNTPVFISEYVEGRIKGFRDVFFLPACTLPPWSGWTWLERLEPPHKLLDALARVVSTGQGKFSYNGLQSRQGECKIR